MDRHELDQAVNRQIEQAFWPWWLAVAYVQPKPQRHEALRGGVETHLAYKGSSVDAVGAFGRVIAVLCGEDDPDGQIFRTWQTRAEDRLMLAIRAGKVLAWGRPAKGEALVELKASNWVGAEVDCSDTCDLVQQGWRDMNWLARVVDSERVVQFVDIHLPREQVMAWADHLESEEVGANLDDALAGDYEAFAAIESEGRELKGGFWSAFVACAWVGSRCTRFTAAAQAYETAKLVERGGPYAAGAWIVLGNVMGERFGVTMSQASDAIKSAIADRILAAGFGHDIGSGQSHDISAAECLQMRVVHDQHGTSLVPGVYGVSWSSTDMRGAFQAEAVPDLLEEVAPPVPVVPSIAPPPMRLADAPPAVKEWLAQAIDRKLPVRRAYHDAREKLGAGVLRQQEAQDLLKEAMAERQLPVSRGRPHGRKTGSIR
jgi:hypothetical protein